MPAMSSEVAAGPRRRQWVRSLGLLALSLALIVVFVAIERRSVAVRR